MGILSLLASLKKFSILFESLIPFPTKITGLFAVFSFSKTVFNSFIEDVY